MDNNFNNLSIIRLIYKWKWQLLIISFVAAVIGAAGSFLIKPLYKSEAVVYPANTSPLSEESRTEQMLQVLESQTIADSIINKYDLWSEYKIKRDKPSAMATMMQRYSDMVKIKKTKYEAITIVAIDQDPQQACDMVNSVLYYYDQMIERLHNEKTIEVISLFQKQLDTELRRADSLKSLYVDLSTQYGITDIGAQSREVTRSLLTGSNKGVELKENLELHASELMEISARFTGAVGACLSLKTEIDGQSRYLNGHMTYSYIISAPYPDDKKCYPIRWLITVLSGAGAFLITLVILFLYENRKKILPELK